MENNIIRPQIFHKRIRMVILLLVVGFFLLGVFQMIQSFFKVQGVHFDIRDWSFILWFVLGAFMILVYQDQEEKANYYIRWTDSELFYKLDKGSEKRLDLSRVKHVNANYSKVFFYMKDGSIKLVNFYSLDPRFKDIQKAISINEKLVT